MQDAGNWTELQKLHGEENRVWVDLDDMSPYMAESFIALEDNRFESHHGVDWKRTAFAFLNSFLRLFNIQIADNIQGGSTITQQLIKNVTGDDDVTIQRKIQEILRALNLEGKRSKPEILEMVSSNG